MNNVFFGSLVEAGIHSQKLENDKNLPRINKTFRSLFKENRIAVKKFSLQAFVKEFHL